jgi:hypothetical protein
MTSWPYSRSCRTASIRSGRAGGLAGELAARIDGPLQMPRPATAAAGYRGTVGATLTFGCTSHRINQKAAQQMRDLASGVEAGSSMPATKLGDGN